MKPNRLLMVVAALACGAGAVLPSAMAGGTVVRVGNLVLRADGGFQPRVLPRRRRVPIRFQGHASIATRDRSLPPALRHVRLKFDRDGKLNTAGLPACPPARLEAKTARQARRLCRGAIVGRGRVSAAIGLLGGRIDVASPLTVFNGPRVGGNRTVVAHAQTSVPIFQAYVVVAPIERRRGRTFGYRTSFDVPPIAGGAGVLTHIQGRLGRRFTRDGERRSYVTARCSDGILQTFGLLYFADGNVLSGSLFKPCNVRGKRGG
jgi:hypothetical protein